MTKKTLYTAQRPGHVMSGSTASSRLGIGHRLPAGPIYGILEIL